MYVISWPLWVTLTVILAGFLTIALSVNPYSPLVRYVIGSRARGQGRWIWMWRVLTTVIGVVLIMLGVLFRPR
jgi:uncharacterized membrane protein